MLKIMKCFFLLLLALLLGSCDSPFKKDDLENLSNDFKKGYEDVKKKLDEITPSHDDLKTLTSDEMAKLFNFEYKVFEIENTLSATEIEAQLAIHGKDRWECFQIVPSGAVLRIYCKRRPETYLRYLPRMFM